MLPHARRYLSTALHFDSSPDTHAVRPVRSVASDSAIEALFDSISYDKAGAIIYMLHDYLSRRTPGAFVAGLCSYLTEHQFGSASGADMWEHLGKASGLPIGEWVEPWFSQAGYPLIEVTTLSDGSAVLLQVGRFMQDLTRTQIAFGGHATADQATRMQSWWVPISYFTSVSSEVRAHGWAHLAPSSGRPCRGARARAVARVRARPPRLGVHARSAPPCAQVHVSEIASSSSFFSIPPARKQRGGFDAEGSDWLKVNFKGAGYYRVNYPPHLWARLVQASTEPGRISDADLANLIDDAFALTCARVLATPFVRPRLSDSCLSDSCVLPPRVAPARRATNALPPLAAPLPPPLLPPLRCAQLGRPPLRRHPFSRARPRHPHGARVDVCHVELRVVAGHVERSDAAPLARRRRDAGELEPRGPDRRAWP